MVLTGTGQGRGKHGADVRFEEDVAVFICLCKKEKAWITEEIVFSMLFEFFIDEL